MNTVRAADPSTRKTICPECGSDVVFVSDSKESVRWACLKPTCDFGLDWAPLGGCRVMGDAALLRPMAPPPISRQAIIAMQGQVQDQERWGLR